MGFSDARLGKLTGASADEVTKRAPRARRAAGVQAHRHLRGRVRLADRLHVFDLRDAVRGQGSDVANEARPSDKKKVVILGGGPNRIGQGIEFDYCCCHAAFALKEAGYETIMVNCNPETVSTDYDTSDRLYFEPLTAEDVLEIIDTERAQRHAARRHRAVRRPDAAQARRGAGEGQGADPRHLARRHRPRRGPRPLQAAARKAQAAPAAERHRHEPEAGARHRRGHRLSDRDPAVLRAGRPRHGDRPRRRAARPLSRAAGGRSRSAVGAGGVGQAAAADRPLSVRRHRGRRRLPVRRQRHLHRRHHGAHRGGRHPFRRLAPARCRPIRSTARRSPNSSARPGSLRWR